MLTMEVNVSRSGSITMGRKDASYHIILLQSFQFIAELLMRVKLRVSGVIRGHSLNQGVRRL